MPRIPDAEFDCRWRSRIVFIHSRGAGLFLGRKPENHEREVTVAEVEALISAGFEIVEINIREETPLCTALARVRSDRPFPDLSAGLPEAALTAPQPRVASGV